MCKLVALYYDTPGLVWDSHSLISRLSRAEAVWCHSALHWEYNKILLE